MPVEILLNPGKFDESEMKYGSDIWNRKNLLIFFDNLGQN